MSHAPFSPRRTLRAFALAALFALAACAPRIDLPQYDLPRPDLEAFRARFTEPALEGDGLAVRASLLYSTPTRANRTDVQLYGEYARPLRMADVLTLWTPWGTDFTPPAPTAASSGASGAEPSLARKRGVFQMGLDAFRRNFAVLAIEQN